MGNWFVIFAKDIELQSSSGLDPHLWKHNKREEYEILYEYEILAY